eukprot:CAMPEP_0181296924 /NCGR_PEP_ID=MMETSP1101-20121128/4961_1 /TAXON_ID=46948 /ORGANISM="Rhodomonas abbreviata, Strain Caron Lab Isolate" /LENGTH=49 /DNA_ID= /DNA_START= /DNA_END= /DNA_ORIENTATION=
MSPGQDEPMQQRVHVACLKLAMHGPMLGGTRALQGQQKIGMNVQNFELW